MKCHYDVLNVSRVANLDEIKKSYKKLAIKWHPDKNLDNTEAATEQFQLIQQAFEVLSDPHERAWYDDHRDAILKGKVGGECEDDSLDVYQYFTASCYKGYGDDEKGFYSVYREVFNKISAEDLEYYVDGDSDIEIPNFGKSDTSAEEVQTFYGYWQSYCTKKSYSWLDPYDTRTSENRRVSRLIDKENKKVRDKARKARNEEVRELVNFVRKRDKRLQAHIQHMQKLREEKANKIEERRKENIKKRTEELASCKESEWSKFSNLENALKDIEANLASEFGDVSDDSSDSNIDDQLYCIACNKLFKTIKTFQNHESSKKHKENVLVLKQNMLDGSGSEHESDNESTAEEGEVLYEYDGVVSDGLEEDPLFCEACGKQFKTSKAINEHKKTKKHMDNYELYKDAMHDILGDEEECSDSKRNMFDFDPNAEPKPLFKPFLKNDKESKKIYDGDEVAEQICNEIDEFTKDNNIIKGDVDKICKQLDDLLDDIGSDSENPNDDLTISDDHLDILKKGPKTHQNSSIPTNVLNSDDDDDDFFTEKRKSKKKQKAKSKLLSNKKKTNKLISVTKLDSDEVDANEKGSETSTVSQDSSLDTKPAKILSKEKLLNKGKKTKQAEGGEVNVNSTCAVCKETFISRSKLFLHLSKTGHSVYIDDKEKLLNKIKNENSGSINNKKNKSKKSNRNM